MRGRGGLSADDADCADEGRRKGYPQIAQMTQMKGKREGFPDLRNL